MDRSDLGLGSQVRTAAAVTVVRSQLCPGPGVAYLPVSVSQLRVRDSLRPETLLGPPCVLTA